MFSSFYDYIPDIILTTLVLFSNLYDYILDITLSLLVIRLKKGPTIHLMQIRPTVPATIFFQYLVVIDFSSRLSVIYFERALEHEERQ